MPESTKSQMGGTGAGVRILIKIVIALAGLIGLLIAGLVGFPYTAIVQDQFGSGAYRTWLEEHRTEIGVAEAGTDFRLGDEAYEARLVLLSEIHGYRAVQAIDLALVQHFAAHGPARTYLAELGPEQALAFNQYLRTGDDGPTRAIFDAWAATQTQWANQEFFAKLGAMRALNETLPEARKIWFVGVDRPSADMGQLRTLMDAAASPAEPGFDGYERVQALNVSLGQRALARDEDAGRYTHILENIDAVAALDPDRSFYGLWGLFHGAKTRVNGASPLAHRLNQDGGAFEGSVVSLTTVCVEGCLNMMPARAIPAFLHGDGNADYIAVPMNFDDALLFRLRGINDAKAIAGDAPVVAFKMTGEGSPYTTGPRMSVQTGYLSMVQGFEYGGPASEVTDYFILMRTSAPLTPWEGTIHDVSGAVPDTGIEGVEAALGISQD